MEEIRLSFRLTKDSKSNATWRILKKRMTGSKDIDILDELLRREAIRLDTRTTHSDMLADIRQQVSGASTEELKILLLRVIDLLEQRGDYVP